MTTPASNPLSNEVYREHGYANRREYIESLCTDYNRAEVIALAQLLGPGEDFDGLLVALEDHDLL